MQVNRDVEFGNGPHMVATALLGLQLLLLASATLFDALALTAGNPALWIAACDLTGIAWLATLAAALWAWLRWINLPDTRAPASAWRIYGAGQALATMLLSVSWLMRRTDGVPPPDQALALSFTAFVLSCAAAWFAAGRAALPTAQVAPCSHHDPEGVLP